MANPSKGLGRGLAKEIVMRKPGSRTAKAE